MNRTQFLKQLKGYIKIGVDSSASNIDVNLHLFSECTLRGRIGLLGKGHYLLAVECEATFFGGWGGGWVHELKLGLLCMCVCVCVCGGGGHTIISSSVGG